MVLGQLTRKILLARKFDLVSVLIAHLQVHVATLGVDKVRDLVGLTLGTDLLRLHHGRLVNECLAIRILEVLLELALGRGQIQHGHLLLGLGGVTRELVLDRALVLVLCGVIFVVVLFIRVTHLGLVYGLVVSLLDDGPRCVGGRALRGQGRRESTKSLVGMLLLLDGLLRGADNAHALGA